VDWRDGSRSRGARSRSSGRRTIAQSAELDRLVPPRSFRLTRRFTHERRDTTDSAMQVGKCPSLQHVFAELNHHPSAELVLPRTRSNRLQRTQSRRVGGVCVTYDGRRVFELGRHLRRWHARGEGSTSMEEEVERLVWPIKLRGSGGNNSTKVAPSVVEVAEAAPGN
jgi:hypothetical protein